MAKCRSTALLTVRAVYEEAYRLDRENLMLHKALFDTPSSNSREYHICKAAVAGNELARDALIHHSAINGVYRLTLPWTRTWFDRSSIALSARDSRREGLLFFHSTAHEWFPDPADDARSLNARITGRKPGYFTYLQTRKLLKQEVV